MPRILLTNDDGIDSEGLHVLARAMRVHGEVVVVAPDSEYSGAGAALGALHLIRPDVHRVALDGLDEVWTVAGPPALCVRFAISGAFGGPFDLVVAGINPGANTSARTPYHSGTIGAVLTGRNAGISGVAVSQDVTVGAIEGQAWDDMLLGQRWDTAAEVASQVVGRLLAEPPAEPSVLNVNVPNLPVDELLGWRYTSLANRPGRSITTIRLEPKPGHHDAYSASFEWGLPSEPDPLSDVGAIRAGYVSLTWLSRISALPAPTSALDAFVG
jgi:5'-nucleotidase